MADQLLDGGNGAFRTVTDFTTGLDAAGLPVYGPTPEVLSGTSAGAIAVGDVVVRVVPTTSTGLRFAKGGASVKGWTVAGVALDKTTAAGQPVRIASRGAARVNVGSGTPAAGDVATTGSTAGQAGVIAAGTGIAAGDIAGTILGEYLGAKDANNIALVYIDRF